MSTINVYIDGFNGEAIRTEYPQFTYVCNADWESNNILESLMCAEAYMDVPFISTYCDILYTPALVKALVECPADIAMGMDTDWVEHYRYRTQHPPRDAEKMTVRDGLVTSVNRGLDPEIVSGEFIGVAKFTVAGSQSLREHYHRCKRAYAGGAFRGSPAFERSMLIHLLDEMIDQGAAIAHVDTPGDYREIDTHEDRALAEKHWRFDP